MKKIIQFIPSVAVLLFLIATAFIEKQTEPWRPDQLMAPKDLAEIINNTTSVKSLIISIGPVGLIKGAVDIGPTHEKDNLSKLKKLLQNENKDRDIVIYCGCCPFKT